MLYAERVVLYAVRMTEYERFVESKIKPLIESGFDAEVSNKLFDFQQWIVKTALKMGRKAIGVELKKTYFDVAARNAESAELENSQMEMFT